MNYRQRPPFSTEFKLAVECCRWAFVGGDPQSIQTLANIVDWGRFLAVSRRHRVQGLIWHCLRSLAVQLPPAIADALKEDGAAVAQQNLKAARQSALLLKSFESADIPLLFIKGLTLGALAYPDPLVKMSWDVDVLVPPGQVQAAADQLLRLNYQLVLPEVDPQSQRFRDWHCQRKESVWCSPDGLYVELHSRLADNLSLIPGITVRSASRGVEVMRGIHLPTLAQDELFAYLCVHGASSAWFRLKWITDLAALIKSCTAADIDRLYARSQELGAGRAAAQALLLASHIYATTLSSALRKDLNGRGVNRWLAKAALAQMARESEPTKTLLGTVSIHLTQIFLLPGTRFKLTEAARQISDWVRSAR